MRLSLPFCTLVLGLAICCDAQTKEELGVLPAAVDTPPATLPADCSAALVVASDQITGSESFVQIKRLLTTIELGHTASGQWLDALHVSSTDSTVGASFLHTNIELSDAVNGYLCASFLSGKIERGKAGSSNEMAVKTLISVYNLMALETIQFRAQLETVAQQSEKGSTQPLSVSTADKITKILQARKDVGGDFQNALVVFALLAVDNSDPNAKTTEMLSMSEDERADLLKQATALSSATPVDEYTRGADLLKQFLADHKGKA